MPLGVLSQIPGLAGYLQGQQVDQEQQMSQLQQVGALQGILAQIQKQQQIETAAQKERQFRAELSQARGAEEQLAVAVKYGDSTHLMGHFDKISRDKATQEMARGRLSQAIQSANQLHDDRMRNATTAEARAAEAARHNGVIESIQRDAVTNTGARITNEGSRVEHVTGRVGAPPVGVPAGATVGPPQWGAMALGTPQAVQDAAGQLRGNLAQGGPGGNIDLGVLSSPAPQTAPAPAAAPSLSDILSSAGAPAAPSNMDARDQRLANMYRPDTVGTGTDMGTPMNYQSPTIPMNLTPPPEIGAGLPPKARGEEISKWRLQQTGVQAARDRSIAVQQGVQRSPESLRDDAMYQIVNGTPRPGSIPTGRQGEGNAYRALIADEIRKIATEKELTPEKLAAGRIENRANSVALSAVTKDLAAITPFKEMLDINAKVAIDLGREIAADKTNSAFINRPILWVKNNLSNRPDIAEYLAQIHFVEVEAARVLTQPRLVGQLTDQAISDIKSILSGNMTIASTEAVLGRIIADGNNRIDAMRRTRDRTISDIRGETPRTRESDKPKIEDFYRR